MDANQILSALADARGAINSFDRSWSNTLMISGAPHLREQFALRPERYSPDAKGQVVNIHRGLRHILWMVDEAESFARQGRTNKAQRWLGFVQGVLFVYGVSSINDSKRSNMPPGEEFSDSPIGAT